MNGKGRRHRVTIKDLQRIIQQEQSAIESATMQDLLTKLRGKPFYIWGKEKHRTTSGYGHSCCFNDMIGRPQKNGIPQPLWDYQDPIYRALTISGYLNSKPTTGYPLCHSMTEKKEKEKEKERTYYYDFKLKHVWIKKATGLGITEFMLDSWCGYAFAVTVTRIVKWS